MVSAASDPFAKHDTRELTGHKHKVRLTRCGVPSGNNTWRGCPSLLCLMRLLWTDSIDRFAVPQVLTLGWNCNGKRLATGGQHAHCHAACCRVGASILALGAVPVMPQHSLQDDSGG